MHSKAFNIHSKPTRKVGFVLKAHGYNGQLRLALDDDFNPSGFLLIGIHNKFVPFAIESFNDESCIIKLNDVNTEDEVNELIGLSVLDFDSETSDEDLPDLEGYTLLDALSGKEYDITGIVEYPGNVLIEFRDQYKDLLIPFHPDIIRDVDHQNKIVTANFPEGLTEL